MRDDGSLDLPEDALRVMITNAHVNEYNEKKLAEILGQEYVIEAVTVSKTQKQFKPQVDNTGAIKGTQLQKTLRFKIGANVMLTANVDTMDCLTNGTFGVVVGFEEKVLSDGKKVDSVLVDLRKERSGKQLRKTRQDLQKQFLVRPVTAISLYEQEFNVSG